MTGGLDRQRLPAARWDPDVEVARIGSDSLGRRVPATSTAGLPGAASSAACARAMAPVSGRERNSRPAGERYCTDCAARPVAHPRAATIGAKRRITRLRKGGLPAGLKGIPFARHGNLGGALRE
ncbi:MAG TPA: hypothetical protein VGA42_01925, partial [Gemmatimonadales bacterium]